MQLVLIGIIGSTAARKGKNLVNIFPSFLGNMISCCLEPASLLSPYSLPRGTITNIIDSVKKIIINRSDPLYLLWNIFSSYHFLFISQCISHISIVSGTMTPLFALWQAKLTECGYANHWEMTSGEPQVCQSKTMCTIDAMDCNYTSNAMTAKMDGN